MEIAFLTTVVPGRATGGEIASNAFVDALRRAGHRVRLVGYARPGMLPPEDPDVVVVEARPIETAGAPLGTVAGWLVDAVRHRLPYSAAKYRSAPYRAAAAAACRDADLVIVDHARLAWLEDDVLGTAPVIAITHNIEHRLYAEQASRAKAPHKRLVLRREHRLVARLEAAHFRRASQVWTLTAADAADVDQVAGAGRARPFAVPVRPTGGLGGPRTTDVAIIGTWTWAPNAAGLHWFCDEVLPLLPAGRRVAVAGRGAEWLVGRPGVTYHGFVPDSAEFMQSARVVAVPSTAGEGVQVKTLDALAAATWVVATPVAARGLDLDGVAAVAGSPSAFAAAIEALLADPATTGPCHAARAWAQPRVARFEAEVGAAVDELQVRS